jgi:hypothetical protein
MKEKGWHFRPFFLLHAEGGDFSCSADACPGVRYPKYSYPGSFGASEGNSSGRLTPQLGSSSRHRRA